MRINAIEEYGLRCLLALAKKGPEEQMTIPEIARDEGLSVSYVSKLLWTLRKAGLVKAERGRSGGFSLSREPEKISLYESLTALGGPLVDEKHCRKFTGQLDRCVHAGQCSIHHMLGSISGFIKTFLSRTSLKDLMADPRRDIFKENLSLAAANIGLAENHDGGIRV